MKLLLSALLLVSANAFADHCNNCKSGEVMDWPQVGGVPVNMLCQTETTVQSVVPVKTCKAHKKVPAWTCDEHMNSCQPVSENYKPISNYEVVQYATVCSEYANEVVAYAKTYEAYECEPCYPQGESSECVLHQPKCGNVTKTIPTTYYVSSYMAGSDNSEGGRVWYGGNKRFDIPACK
ncbi:MAG: hypothetical protein IPM57_03415 [Oligoflexia bacterium]|nr:hypothetical protein [Oligoflexia bacterium]